MGRKRKSGSQDASDGSPADLQKAFRRMAFIFANLVCGIWVILLAATVAMEEAPPDTAWLAALVVVGAPVAWAIPYGLVRLIGLVAVAVKRHRKT